MSDEKRCRCGTCRLVYAGMRHLPMDAGDFVGPRWLADMPHRTFDAESVLLERCPNCGEEVGTRGHSAEQLERMVEVLVERLGYSSCPHSSGQLLPPWTGCANHDNYDCECEQRAACWGLWAAEEAKEASDETGTD